MSKHAAALPSPPDRLTAEPIKRSDDKSKALDRRRELRKQLEQTVNFDGIEPNTPLVDTLEMFADKYGMTLVVDTKAFAAAGIGHVEEVPVMLPKMKDVRKSTLLRLLLRQVEGKLNTGTYLVRADYIEITTTEFRGLTQVVQADIEKRPLVEALQELAAECGMDIVVDQRVAEKVRTPVTATLYNSFLDTSLTLLTDMADLDWVCIDRVIYVTTPENAKAKREKARTLYEDRSRALKSWK